MALNMPRSPWDSLPPWLLAAVAESLPGARDVGVTELPPDRMLIDPATEKPLHWPDPPEQEYEVTVVVRVRQPRRKS